jgi:RNA polymerase sigma factor (sigma-70 family)
MATPAPCLTSLNDVTLIKRSDQSSAAFGELYDRHVGAVHAWLARRIAWAAADLTAETFARAWLSRATFRDHRDGSALPWLLGIAGNLLADTARHDRIETRARERLGLPLDLAIEDGFSEVEERLSPRATLTRCVADLPDHERAALQLRVVQELPFDEVARRLSIRPAAARLRVSRALRRLAHTVPEEER